MLPSHSTPSDLVISPADSQAVNPLANPSDPNATLLQRLTNGVKSQCGGETRMAVFADKAQSID